MSRAADRQLLFGILALQNDFIDREQLLAALRVWVDDKSRPLEDVLREQGALTEDVGDLLGALVAKHIERHGGDAEQSLGVLSSVPPIQEAIQKLGDADMQAMLTVIPPAEGPAATASVSVRPAGDRFRIVRPHAEGGLGRVSVAIDGELDREVAFKEIKESYADDQLSRERFTFEAEVTGSLEHPGIVPVYGLGHHDDGRPFYAMRFVRGHSLQDAIRDFHAKDAKGTWSADEREGEFRKLLGRFCDVCDAIEYAHSRGVLHRDLKPGNVMLGKYGETLVVDWGLAKIIGRDQPTDSIDGDATLQPRSGSSMAPTLAGTTIGSPAYMSPEQAEGRLDDLGPASDVYSLGATLYALLTNTAPHLPTEGDSDLPSILAVAREGRIDRPRDRNPDVPKPLEAVCLKAMSLKPSARYATPAALAEDVQAWLADRCPAAYAEPLPTRVARVCRRHRSVVTASATSVVLALVAGVSLVFQLRLNDANLRLSESIRQLDEKNSELAVANASLDTANRNLMWANDALDDRNAKLDITNGELATANDTLHAARARARQLAYNNSIRLVQLLLDRRSFAPPGPEGERPWAGARQLLEKCAEEDRGWEWHHLAMQLDGRPTRSFRESPGLGADVAFSVDGTRLISATVDGRINVRDIESGKLHNAIKLQLDGSHVQSISVTQDRTWVATTDEEGTLRLCNLDGRTAQEMKGHSNSILSVAFSAGDSHIATGSRDGTVRVWNPATSESLAELEHDFQVEAVAFSPNGSQLATADGSTIRIWDMGSYVEAARLPHTQPILALAFGPDGNRIALADDRGAIKISNVRDGATVAKWDSYDAIANVSFTPDGLHLATYGRASVQIWDYESRDRNPKPLKTYSGHASGIRSLAFSNDGAQMAVAGEDATFDIWDVSTPQPKVALVEGLQPSGLAFNSGWTHFARKELEERPSIELYDARTGAVVSTLTGHEGDSLRLAFSPDATRVVSVGDGSVQLWDCVTGGIPVATLPGPASGVLFSPNGTQLLTLDVTEGGLWDLEIQRRVATLKPTLYSARCATFSPDGKRIVMAHGSGLSIWNAKNGELIRTLYSGHKDEILSVSYSPTGDRFVTTGDDGTLRIWDRSVEVHPKVLELFFQGGRMGEAGKELEELEANPIRYDPLVMGDWEEPRDPEPLLVLDGHSDSVSDVVHSPDGARIASVSRDGTVGIWDSRSGRLVSTLVHTPLPSELTCEFFHDGTRLVVSGAGRVTLWDTAQWEMCAEFRADHAYVAPDGRRVVLLDYEGAQLLLGDERNAANAGRHREWRDECAAVAESRRNWFAAAFHIQRLVVLDPKDARLFGRLGRAFFRQEKYDEALPALAKIGNEPHVEWLLYRAMTHHRLGNTDEARDSLAAAIAAIPDEATEAVVELRAEAEGLIDPRPE